MSDTRSIFPITRLVTRHWPSNIIDLPTETISSLGDALDWIGYDPLQSYVTLSEDGGYQSYLKVVIIEDVRLPLPIFDGAEIGLGTQDNSLQFGVRFSSSPLYLAIDDISFSLVMPPNILGKARLNNTTGVFETIKIPASLTDEDSENNPAGYEFIWRTGIETNLQDYFSFKIAAPFADFDSNVGDRNEELPAPVTIPDDGDDVWARIGETPFLIQLSGVNIIADDVPADLLEEYSIVGDFRGILVEEINGTYAADGANGVVFSGYRIAVGKGGFSGIIGIDLSSVEGLTSEEGFGFTVPEPLSLSQLNGESQLPAGTLRVSLQNFNAVVQRLLIKFEQSIPVASDIAGYLFMPMANKWFRFRATLGGPNADFMLDIGGTTDAPLINLEHEYFEIKADSIAYKMDDSIHYAVISGSIKPKIPGFDWPEMKIENLSVSSEGDISIPGGWIKAPETITLNFSAFKIGINEIGFGNQEPDSDDSTQTKTQWLGFSGELNLVEGLDLKASVDGLKFSWPKGGGTVTTTLKGIAVDFEIPNTLSFKGSVNYEELTKDNNGETGLTGNLFRGNIKLELTTVRLEIEAELIIGKLVDSDGNQFTTFFIVLGAQLPAGIPLGATGVSLYGVKGLGAMNAGPTKTEEQSWYDWYMALPERKITSIEKYKPIAGYNAFGAGVTLGTMFDDGFTLNMSVMLAVLTPGPVIILEGKANLLKQRMEGAQEEGGPEGAFYLLAVLDGRAGTFMLNVDVKYSLKDIITVAASLEAYFDFNDSSQWYVYIGREPDEKRVRAEILSLFGANTYFMIDNNSFKTGASIGFDLKKKYGPVQVFLIAKIGFDAAIFWQPMQLEGSLAMEAGLGISVFGIGLELYLAMMLAGKVPKPYWIHGTAEVGLKLFWPIPDIKFNVEFEWRQEAETQPVWPLLKECNFVHHKFSALNIAIELRIADQGIPEWDDFVVVPVDSRPLLTFARPLHNLKRSTSVGVVHTFNTTQDDVGGTIFKYKLNSESIVLEKYYIEDNEWRAVRKSINEDDDYVFPANNGEVSRFIIDRTSITNLQNDKDPNEPKIQLWKYSASDHTNSFSREDEVVNNPACPPKPSQQLIHINWVGVENGTEYDFAFEYAGLRFLVSQSTASFQPFVKNELLYCSDITILFPEPIYLAGIESKFVIAGEAYFRGEKVTDLVISQEGCVVRGISPITSIALTNAPVSEQITPFIKSLNYMTQKAVTSLLNSNDTSPAAKSEKTAGYLSLEPASYYRLVITTSVDVDDVLDKVETTNFAYFRTDEGPGVERLSNVLAGTTASKKLDYCGKPINQLATYIERTLPNNGALNHYLDCDVGVLFNESYVEKLYRSNEIRFRFKDRNGKVLAKSVPDFLSVLSFLPLFPPGAVSLAKNQEDGGCADRPIEITPAPYLNTRPDLPFKANNLYVADILVGDQVVHSFQFTSSRYRSFTDHVLGDYTEAVISPIELPIQVLEGVHSLVPLYDSITDYRSGLSEFYSISVLLQTFELLEELKIRRANINNQSHELFSRIDVVFNNAISSVGMLNRPKPDKFELFKVPFSDALNVCLILIESPEPIDWLRVKGIGVSDGVDSFNIQFVWNKDQTRAYVCRRESHFIPNSDYTFKFNYSGEKDPITGVQSINSSVISENVSFDTRMAQS